MACRGALVITPKEVKDYAYRGVLHAPGGDSTPVGQRPSRTRGISRLGLVVSKIRRAENKASHICSDGINGKAWLFVVCCFCTQERHSFGSFLLARSSGCVRMRLIRDTCAENGCARTRIRSPAELKSDHSATPFGPHAEYYHSREKRFFW